MSKNTMKNTTNEIDPKHPTKKVKATELKPGDAVTHPHPGMVIGVDIKGVDPTWNGKPNISFYDMYDCTYGCMHGPLDLESEYEILTERKDILEMYKKIDYELLQNIANTIDRRKEFKDVFNGAIHSMNLKKWADREDKNLKGD